MNWVYFDASALIKRYSVEEGTDLVNELFRQLPSTQMICAMIGVAEIVAALTRKRNDGRLPQRLFAQALLELNQEVIQNDSFRIAAIDDELTLSAIELIPRHNINATDATILRSCLNLRDLLAEQQGRLILWSSDKRLLKAAQLEGLIVYDPEVESSASLRRLLSFKAKS